MCDRPVNLIYWYRSQAQQQKHDSSCICIYFPLKFNKIPQRLFDPLLCGWLLLSLWLSAITSKVTRFTIIEQFIFLSFLPPCFSCLRLYPLLVAFIPLLPYLRPLPLLFLCLESYALWILVSYIKALFIGFLA